jgi:hypothetical protein
MMWKLFATLVLILAASTPAVADQSRPTLQKGTYEVAVRLVLPHLEDNLRAEKTATICISGTGDTGTRGLVVLSDNTPFARCPISNVVYNGDILTFDIVCQGANAARASATYTLASQQFRGRIAMKMDGKNMTMTETQFGRRVGDCAPSG